MRQPDPFSYVFGRSSRSDVIWVLNFQYYNVNRTINIISEWHFNWHCSQPLLISIILLRDGLNYRTIPSRCVRSYFADKQRVVFLLHRSLQLEFVTLINELKRVTLFSRNYPWHSLHYPSCTHTFN